MLTLKTKAVFIHHIQFLYYLIIHSFIHSGNDQNLFLKFYIILYEQPFAQNEGTVRNYASHQNEKFCVYPHGFYFFKQRAKELVGLSVKCLRLITTMTLRWEFAFQQVIHDSYSNT